MDLEHLQSQADQVEGADDAELAPGLEPQRDEDDLDDHHIDQQGIVAGQRHPPPAPHEPRGSQADEDGDREGAAGHLGQGELSQAQRHQAQAGERMAPGGSTGSVRSGGARRPGAHARRSSRWDARASGTGRRPSDPGQVELEHGMTARLPRRPARAHDAVVDESHGVAPQVPGLCAQPGTDREGLDVENLEDDVVHAQRLNHRSPPA